MAKAELQLYTRCARRLERLAVFSSAQGREERGVELEGLTAWGSMATNPFKTYMHLF